MPIIEPQNYSLGEKQRIFTRLVADLIKYVYSKGYELSFGDAYRDPVLARIYAQKGVGIEKSLHTSRIAIDLNLFKDGNYLTDSKSYEFMGIYWEGLSSPGIECCWGGRFSKPDGNHFSISHGGRK